MLDVDNATAFLLRHGLIDTEAILHGDLVVRSVARRNRNLLAHVTGGPGYFLKQPDDPAFGGSTTLRAEAAFYDACRRGLVSPEVARLVPNLARFDEEAVVLVLDRVAEAVPFWSLDWTLANRGLPAEAGRLLGQALGTVHRALRLDGPEGGATWATLATEVPWIFQAHRPGPEALGTLSAANLQTLRILQGQPGLTSGLERLGRDWRIESVIHGDLKADNVLFLAAKPGPPPSPARVWLVDWELVQLGDPAWDVAGALHDLLNLWILSIPQESGVSLESLADRARHPLRLQQAAARSLWRAYRIAAEIPETQVSPFLRRAIAYSAARLIQSAYELAFEAHRLPTAAVLMLQVGANLLDDPEAGQVRLLGIPREGPE